MENCTKCVITYLIVAITHMVALYISLIMFGEIVFAFGLLIALISLTICGMGIMDFYFDLEEVQMEQGHK